MYPILSGSPGYLASNDKSGSRSGWVEGLPPYLSFNRVLYVSWKNKSQQIKKNNNLKK
jgi:hypothetical protein